MAMICLKNGGVDKEDFERIEKIWIRQLSERGCEPSANGTPVTLRLDKRIDEDEYRIFADGTLVSGSKIGLLAALGRYLRDGSFDGKGGFTPATEDVALKMRSGIRGMYFASHFFNFYHVAPMEKIYEILDSLALRGCNALMAWYDMHHYTYVDDPESVKMIQRLKQIFRYAKALGMKLCFGTLANEAFSGTDDAIKADWRAVNGYKTPPVGHYHVEICPNAPGGMEEILRQRRAVLRAFSDIVFDFVSFWPYDQGGCTCAKCVPWGANGFLKIAPQFRKVVEEEMPGTKILCSTWRFGDFIDGEWQAFYQRMQEEQFQFFAYLFDYFSSLEAMPEGIRHGVMPGGKKMLSFPEISMRGAVPWGGFGANPMPAYLERNEREMGKYYEGGFPYSEGIFSDINQAIMLGFATGQYDTAYDILRDYSKYEFCAPHPEAVASLMFDMEETLPRHRVDQHGVCQDYLRKEAPADTVFRFVFENPQKIDTIYERAKDIDAQLPQAMRATWRWRILYLRAAIDFELYHNDGLQTEACEAYYQELTEIYYAQEADYCVSPPSREAMRLNRGGFLL